MDKRPTTPSRALQGEGKRLESLKARIMVWAALGGGEFLVLGDSSRDKIFQVSQSDPCQCCLMIIPAEESGSLVQPPVSLLRAPLCCLDRNHSRLPKPQKAAQSWMSSSDEGACLYCLAGDLSSPKVTRTYMAESQPNVLTLTI